MSRIEIIKITESNDQELIGKYAVIQNTPYITGKTFDFFENLEQAKKFMREILANEKTTNWLSEKEIEKLKKLLTKKIVRCSKCGYMFKTNAKEDKYGRITCSKCKYKFSL